MAHLRKDAVPPTGFYVPLVRSDSAQLDALAWVSDAAADAITPMVEVVSERFDQTVQRLADGWGRSRRLMLDTGALDPGGRVEGPHHVVELFDLCRGRVRGLPVGGLARGIDHMAAIAGVVAAQRSGAALRVAARELAAGESERRIDAWLAVVDLGPEEVDLVLDLGTQSTALASARQVLADLPHARRWRSLTLMGTGFLDIGVGGREDAEELLERPDWRLWSALAREELPRLPAFGDRAVAAAGRLRGVTIAYTCGRHWLVVRRRRLAPYSDELRAASQAVLARPEYAGPEHCRGCALIEACASGDSRARIEALWAGAACHHMEASVSQLAEPSRAA